MARFPAVLGQFLVYFLLPLSSTLLLILLGVATGQNNWLLAGDRIAIPNASLPFEVFVPSNGRLGLQNYCPNTAALVAWQNFLETGKLLQEAPRGPCYFVQWNCEVTYCIFNQSLIESTGRQAGICATYDLFNPKPILGDSNKDLDIAYNVINVFPNGGSCSTYNATRFFHWLSFICACLLVALSIVLVALYPLAKLFEQLQDILKYAVLLMGITFFCAFILIVLTLSIWDLGITNPANIGTVGGVSYSHGFWLEVSACVFAFVFTPLPILLGSCELPDPPGKHYEEETGPVNRQARERAEKEIEQLKAERDAKIISIKSLEAGLIGKDEKIARLVTEVTDREQKIAKLMDEVDNLRSSTAVEPPPDPPAKV